MACGSEYGRWVAAGVAWLLASCGDDTAIPEAEDSTGAESNTSGTSADASTSDPSTTSGSTSGGSSSSGDGSDASSGDESSSSSGGEVVGDEPADRLFSVLAGTWELDVDAPGCPAYDCPGDELWGIAGPGFEPVQFALYGTELGTRYKPVLHTLESVEESGLGIGMGASHWIMRRARTDDLVLVPDRIASPYVGAPEQNYLPLLAHDVLEDGDWQFVFPALTLRFSPDGMVAGVEDPLSFPRLWFDDAPRIADPIDIFFPDPWDEIFWGDDDDAKIALLEDMVEQQPHVNGFCSEQYTMFWPEVAWRFLQYDDAVVRENAVRVLLDLANPELWICTPRLIALDMLAGRLGDDDDAGVRALIADGIAAMTASGELWFMPCEVDEALAECVVGDADADVRAACQSALDEITAAQVTHLACVETEQGGEDFVDAQHWTCGNSCTATAACGLEVDADACLDACLAELEPLAFECMLAHLGEHDCLATVPCEELETSDICDAASGTVVENCT